MRWLLVVVLLSAASAALAQPAALTEASQLLAEGEFARALKKLDAAVKRTSVPTELAALQLTRARCLLALSRRPQALAAFTAALEHDVTIEPGDDASPDALALFDEARSAFPGTLAVTVDADATVRVDGRDLGPAPLKVQLRHGAYDVEAIAADGRSARQTVQVRAGRPVDLALNLPPPAPPAGSPTPAPVVAAPPATDGAPLATTREGPPRSRVGWIPLGAGVAVTAAGGVSLWQARVQHDRLTNTTLPPLSTAEEQSAISTGKTLQTVGWIGVGVGAAAAVAGVVLLALPPAPSADAAAHPVASVAPDGTVWLGVVGVWP